MLIVLHGPDSFRRISKKREILREFKERHPHHVVEVFDMGQKDTAVSFREFTRSSSLFDPVKMAVLDDFSFSCPSEVRNALRDVLESTSTTALIMSDSKPPQKDWGFLSKKPVLGQEFEYLEGPAWHNFLKEKAKESGVDFSEKGMEKLSRAYEKNTWGAVTEISRLAGRGKKQTDPEDINSMEGTGDFFQLALSFKSGTPSTKTAVLEKLLARGEAPQKIFFMIASLLPDKKRLAAYDAAVKAGKMDWEEALLSLSLIERS
jgi:DNA polymerase III delta subunit